MEGLRLGEARGAKVAKIAGNRIFVSESIRPGTGDGRKGRVPLPRPANVHSRPVKRVK